ncbi:AtpZ/AtpI family protein [Marivirga sp.]|uniref:AtpZ/AtpI family protein n=1 Tax=Marivirga sp. TaxID=2018662 RepID=UPI002D7E2321|nr:AtpZ/AtpI family protein [Marivirga sp.]HET8861183.1 AtpZ/AtpI family protein [Marivirga sp.]
MKKQKPYKNYLKFTGLAFQMLATIGAFVLLGQWVDSLQQTEKPYYTMGLSLVGIAISLYQIIKELN